MGGAQCIKSGHVIPHQQRIIISTSGLPRTHTYCILHRITLGNIPPTHYPFLPVYGKFVQQEAVIFLSGEMETASCTLCWLTNGSASIFQFLPTRCLLLAAQTGQRLTITANRQEECGQHDTIITSASHFIPSNQTLETIHY